jgi:predicted acetyltransferase
MLEESEYRTSSGVFRGSLHRPPPSDEDWERVKASYPPQRTFGAFEGSRMIGSAYSMPMPVAVPGGATLPAAAVTRVGVAADRTRRGVLTALMREQLTAVAAAGEPIAALRASEYRIYGRYGYGPASRARDFEIDVGRARFHRDVPSGGSIRLLDRAEAQAELPALFRRLDLRRPGTLQRSDVWWGLMLARLPEGPHPTVVAVHTDDDGTPDGYVVYCVEDSATPADRWGLQLVVEDLHSASTIATAQLWKFVLGVDLVHSVRGWQRPLDEPLELLLEDARACRTTGVGDGLWLRLVDVHAALSARSWGDAQLAEPAESVVIGVTDAFLPANSGSYGLSPDGVKRTDDERAQLELTVADLGRLYLGDVSPSGLANAGRLTVRDPAALPAADALFRAGVPPWCGTMF